MITQVLLFCAIAYLIGAIPFALIIGKLFYNTDIRTMGSGNLGTTNTFRCLGKKAGVMVFILDISKGIVATFLPTLSLGKVEFLSIFGAFAMIGHVYPIFANFITGYVSLGSILICLTSIVYLTIFETGIDKWVMIVMCIFVIYMHKKNIQRLLNGTENQSKAKLRLGRKK